MIADREFSDENSTFDAGIEKNSQEFGVKGVKSTPTFQSEKSDSGMEEESFLQESANISEDTEEENEIVVKRPKGKKRMIIDDADEDDDNEQNKPDLLGEEGSDSVVHKDECDTSSLERQAGSHLDGGGEMDKDIRLNSPNPPLQVEHENEKGVNEDDHPFQLNFKDKDVYDAESSDEEETRSSQNGPNDESLSDRKQKCGNIIEKREEDDDDDGGNENDEVHENDEGFDEDELDPELLKKLKKLKGASKSTKDREKYSRKAKPTADKMLEIYSESQRLTRDSRVNLPYYEPEEKSLDDFLARASKKKQEYAALKRANDYQKAQIIHEKLSVTPPKLIPSKRSLKKLEHQISSTQEVMSVQPSSSSNGISLHDSGLVSQDLTHSQQASQSSTVVLQSSLEPDQYPHFNSADDEADELPDLVEKSTISQRCTSLVKISASDPPKTNLISTDTQICSVDGESESKCSEQNMSVKCIKGQFQVQVQNDSACVEGHASIDKVPLLQKDPSTDLFSSQSVLGQDSQSLHDENRETDFKFVSGQQLDESSPSSLVTVVNETPLSTQSTQQSTFSLSSSTASGQLQTNVSNADHQLIETHVIVSQEDGKCGNESSASIKVVPQAPQDNTDAPRSDITLASEQETGVTPKCHKSIMDKLQRQGLSLPPAPKLIGTPNDVICLDELDNQKISSKNPGVLRLMDRLARHNRKKAPKQAYDVDISIIEKENVQGQQELKLKSVKYHVQPEEQLIASDGAPGSCRLKLNQFLKVGMKKKREDGRRKRLEQHQLDNEEGFEKADEYQEDEEEEAEMTDDEDEDSDEDEEEPMLGDYGAGSDDDGEDYNPLLDTEAKEDDDEEENEALSDFNEDSNDFHLNFEVSDEESEVDTKDNEEEEEEENNEDDKDELELTSVKKKKRQSAALLSDDDDDNEEEEAMSNDRKNKHSLFDEDHTTSQSLWSSDMMTPLSRHLEDTQPQGQTKFRRQSSCSPDLYATANVAEEYESSPGPNSYNDSHSQSFDYAHSQMLDADGYLKVAQTQKPPKSRISLLAQQDDIGGFGSSLSIGQIFGGATSQAQQNLQNDGDDDNMRELMGLCSGKFPKADDDDSLPSSQTRLKKNNFEVKDLFDDEDAYDPFRILSQDENAQDFHSLKQKSALSDSENEEDKENKNLDQAYSDDESENEETEDAPKFTGFKDKKKGIRREFLEEEAELSGSEFDSDENVDLAEEDDILEEEEGDRDMAGVSERKLRDQVGRLHMKQLQDDDDREILRYKEMYLQDGDLYTDGRGRRRNFRWKDVDNNSQQDMFTNESDDEQVEEDLEETQWRKDRYERDKFLEESENKGNNEDSQLVKLGQGFLQKKDSFGISSPEILPNPKERSTTSDKKKFQLPKKGSFLTRGKDTLLKIAKIAKSAFGGNVKNGRGFVFQSVDEKETQQEPSPPPESTVQPPKRKAHIASQFEHAAKKPKLSRNATSQMTHEKPAVKRKNSILHLLD
ncbi:hypothetical protein RRG08_050015 [Elysia crispata]|uniref:Claspin n=1 Tax=Elysia crispata TaxID=231223 RepID=A0AAE1ECR0_9GAST|nr:hypothetical protein RRG08_050015 [Elysia crispata]